jgi:hypothetical protein
VCLAAAVALVAVLAMIGPLWLSVIVPRWLVRGATIALLWAIVGVFLVALAAAPTGLVVSAIWLRRARRRGERWHGAARALLLSASCLVGATLLEWGAAAGLSWSHRIPNLPRRFLDDRAPVLRIVVIGESSARGEPYHQWLSVGRIVAWQLERVFPDRRIEVDVRARSGLCLADATRALEGLTRRPDAILVYAGHNEFQARYGWWRNVGHYAGERPERPRRERGLDALARCLSLCALIAETLDRHRVDIPPPAGITRALVDHPTVTPQTYATLRTDFRRRLEATAAYCAQIGALPLLIVPPANDAGFEPNRSVLAPATQPAERSAFARAFLEARREEARRPSQAALRYRGLLDRHPEFAEAHFRLARLLERAGQAGEARRHYEQARDLDGFPLRCPTDFQQAYHEVAARHRAVLVDGPRIFRRLSAEGAPDDRLFHDAHHPVLRGYLALAQELLDQLHARRAFGWPEGVAAPVIDPAECARHFGMDAPKWAEVCAASASFYDRTAYIRYDPSERLEKARRYGEAGRRIAAGSPPAEAGVPGLGP